MSTAQGGSGASGWVPYDFAVLRVVPHPWMDRCHPVGVIVHAPTAAYLGLRLLEDGDRLATRASGVDLELLVRYLDSLRRIVAGDPDAGALARQSRSERFHWATAPRSDVLQAGPVHGGLCHDPAQALAALYATYVEEG